jgi:hypothetical protein
MTKKVQSSKPTPSLAGGQAWKPTSGPSPYRKIDPATGGYEVPKHIDSHASAKAAQKRKWKWK